MRAPFLKLCAGLILLATSTAVQAQDATTNRVSANTDWSVFVENDPAQCWIVSQPRETLNTKDGRVVVVNRGDIRMFVSYWPENEKRGEVSFTGGYPFQANSNVSVEIGTSTFQLFTDGQRAWAATPADDAKIVTAMKRGAEAVVTGVSSRGTTTRDTFSLLGFTASVEDAEARCG